MSSRPDSHELIIAELLYSPNEYNSELSQAVSETLDENEDLRDFCEWAIETHKNTEGKSWYNSRKSWKVFRDHTLVPTFEREFELEEVKANVDSRVEGQPEND